MLISSIALMVMSIMQFVPGLIHVFAPDGGAKSIAGFTNYESAQQEILWAFGVFGTD